MSICSDDICIEELKLIDDLLRKYRYPSKLLRKYMFETKLKLQSLTVPKRTMFLKLQLKGDIAGEIITRHFYNALGRTFNEVRLCPTFSGQMIVSS